MLENLWQKLGLGSTGSPNEGEGGQIGAVLEVLRMIDAGATREDARQVWELSLAGQTPSEDVSEQGVDGGEGEILPPWLWANPDAWE